MKKEFHFICTLPNGIHARPASYLEERARQFSADITLTNLRNGKQVSVKSVLSLVSSDVRMDDECVITFSGDCYEDAFDFLSNYLEKEFPFCDEELIEKAAEEKKVEIPRVLRDSELSYLTGRPVVNGICRGFALKVNNKVQFPAEILDAETVAAEEIEKAQQAVQALINHLNGELEELGDSVEAAITKAHLSIVRDPEFAQRVTEQISANDCSCGKAILAVSDFYAEELLATGNAILRERVADIQDVSGQLLINIYGNVVEMPAPVLDKPTVVVAENLTPSAFLNLDRQYLKGMVLCHAGDTSHVIILARSFGIPTLVGVEGQEAIFDGQELLIDADRNLLITEINTDVGRFYQREMEKLNLRRQELSVFMEKQAKTKDGVRIEVAANIATADEAIAAFKSGAEGIGLFRTEMLYMDRTEPPSEEEQFDIYKKVLEAAEGKPVIVRTFDIGGDKSVAYLKIGEEENPFLGYRGVRIYPEFKDLITVQLRALIRASAFGNLKVMIPMISQPGEMTWVREVMGEVCHQLDEEGIDYNSQVPLGMMVETPSAAFAVDSFTDVADFFSIGTNDLTQYFFAVDRDNAKVRSLYDNQHPSFLRILQHVITTARENNRWVGICGEMAGSEEIIPLITAMQPDEISMSSPKIASVKASMSQLDSANCKELLEKALATSSSDEVKECAKGFKGGSNSLPLLDSKMIVLDADCNSKAEAIKALVDKFYIHGRTETPGSLEEALWKREETYSTGFGYGFAIPHCKSDFIKAGTIGLIRLKEPTEWGALDGEGVKVVIMLAMKSEDAGNGHMKVFSTLARKVMNDEFRKQLETLETPELLAKFLQQQLGL